jgi:hypothetical protein
VELDERASAGEGKSFVGVARSDLSRAGEAAELERARDLQCNIDVSA